MSDIGWKGMFLNNLIFYHPSIFFSKYVCVCVSFSLLLFVYFFLSKCLEVSMFALQRHIFSYYINCLHYRFYHSILWLQSSAQLSSVLGNCDLGDFFRVRASFPIIRALNTVHLHFMPKGQSYIQNTSGWEFNSTAPALFISVCGRYHVAYGHSLLLFLYLIQVCGVQDE